MEDSTDEHFQLFSNGRNFKDEDNAALFARYREEIARFSLFGMTMFSLFGLHTRKYIYLDDHYARLISDATGDDDPTKSSPAFHQGLHPDDLRGVYHAEREAYRLIRNMPSEARFDYFLITPVRMRKKDGSYRLVMRCIMEYKAGRKDEFHLLMIAVDVFGETSHDFKGAPILCNKHIKAMNCLDPGKACTDLKIELSERELEIVALAGKKYTSKEIADQLFISSDAVASHRKNILRKYKTSNIEAVYTMMVLIGVLQR